MRFDAGTKTRILEDMELSFDPTGTTVEIKIDAEWYPATWIGSPVAASGKWTQTARTTGYFAGPEVVTPGAAVVLTQSRHLTQTRVTSGSDIIVADSSPVDVA